MGPCIECIVCTLLPSIGREPQANVAVLRILEAFSHSVQQVCPTVTLFADGIACTLVVLILKTSKFFSSHQDTQDAYNQAETIDRIDTNIN